MDKLLQARITKVYPTGKFWEYDETALGESNQAARLNAALGAVVNTAPLRISPALGSKLRHSFAITHTGEPTYDEWIRGKGNRQKIEWCKVNARPYVVFWLRISRIADCYYFYYNHWKPRGETGYMDADCQVEPNDSWRKYETAIRSNLHDQGFTHASGEMLSERVPFVTDDGNDEIPDNDPRWDDDDFQPPLVPASVHRCLFGDY